jgi:hypothetical protein
MESSESVANFGVISLFLSMVLIWDRLTIESFFFFSRRGAEKGVQDPSVKPSLAREPVPAHRRK